MQFIFQPIVGATAVDLLFLNGIVWQEGGDGNVDLMFGSYTRNSC